MLARWGGGNTTQTLQECLRYFVPEQEVMAWVRSRKERIGKHQTSPLKFTNTAGGGVLLRLKYTKKTHKNPQNSAAWPSNLSETLTSPSEPGQDGDDPLLGENWR